MKKQILLPLILVTAFAFSVNAQAEKFTFKSSGTTLVLREYTYAEGDIVLSSNGGDMVTILPKIEYPITAGIEYTVTGKFSSLDIWDNGLTELNVSELTELEVLDCNDNEITILDVSGLVKLQGLWCSNNRLKALDVLALKQLVLLDCDENQIENVDVLGLVNLEMLWCQHNNITNLDVSGLINLEELGCAGNQIDSLDFSGLINLKELHCQKNKLKWLDVSGLTALKKIYCSDNQLEVLNIKGLINLKLLVCNDNSLAAINASELNSLKELYCYNNRFSVCGLDSLFLSLPEKSGADGAEVYIANGGSDESPINECRTYIAKDKNWKVLDLNHGEHIEIVDSEPYGCIETSIPEIVIPQTEMWIYPNPVISELQIKADKTIMEVSVFDMSGKLLLQEIGGDAHLTIATSALKPGIYTVRVQTTADRKNFKIIKK